MWNLLPLLERGLCSKMKIGMDWTDLPADAGREIEAEFKRIRTGSGKTKPYELRNRMQQLMMENVGVYRTEETLSAAVEELAELRRRFNTDIAVDDRGYKFNTDVMEAWELGCLIDLAEVTAISARW